MKCSGFQSLPQILVKGIFGVVEYNADHDISHAAHQSGREVQRQSTPIVCNMCGANQIIEGAQIMRKILTGTIFVLIIGLTACGRSEPHDVIDNATQAQENIGGVPLESSPEPQESEPEPTHTTYTIHGLTLEMPVDWQAFRHPTYDQIWIHPPSDAPRRRDQTRVQISSEPIGGYVADIDEWLAGFIDPAGPPPLTILGGVEAFDGRMRGVVGDDGVLFGVDSFFIDENARGQHFQVFHNRRFYFIRFLTADGEHWETLEQIRASMIFAGGTANHTGIGYVRETTETWQEAFEETLRFYSNLSLRDWETGWIFALHDINRDGVPELFLAMEQITGHVYYRYIYMLSRMVR
jgi:hypothetical protein